MKHLLRFIDIELTNYCNLNCWMCPRKSMLRQVGFMSMETLHKIMSTLDTEKLMGITLHLYGESILHKKIGEIIREINNYAPQAKVCMSTNATLLTSERYRKIANSLDELVISLDGHDSRTYATNRVNGDFGQVINNLKAITEIRERDEVACPSIIFQMIKLPGLEESAFYSFVKPFLKLEDQVYFKEPSNFAGNVTELKGRPLDACPYLHSRAVVYWNGDVSTCCFDVNGINLMGSVGQEGIEEIFNNKKFNIMRKWYSNGELRKKNILCSKCLKI